MKTTCGKT